MDTTVPLTLAPATTAGREAFFGWRFCAFVAFDCLARGRGALAFAGILAGAFAGAVAGAFAGAFAGALVGFGFDFGFGGAGGAAPAGAPNASRRLRRPSSFARIWPLAFARRLSTFADTASTSSRAPLSSASTAKASRRSRDGRLAGAAPAAGGEGSVAVRAMTRRRQRVDGFRWATSAVAA